MAGGRRLFELLIFAQNLHEKMVNRTAPQRLVELLVFALNLREEMVNRTHISK